MSLSIKDFTSDVDFSMSNKDIAKKLGCSAGTVARYRSILGAQKTDRKPPSTIDFSGVDLSRPVKEIAAELGCNPHTVTLARVKAGISRKRNIDFSEADWSKTNPELAREYGCTAETVWIARKRLGIPQRPRGGKKGRKPAPHKALNIRLPLAMADALERRASHEGLTASAWVRQAIESQLSQGEENAFSRIEN